MTSINDEHQKQIEKGLEVVDFIQKSRQQNLPRPTYGRSAIELPTTKQRTAAWEAFGVSQLENSGEQEGATEVVNGTTDGGDEHGVRDDAVSSREEGQRAYREGKWDDEEGLILEDPMVTDIQDDGKRREITNSKSPYKSSHSKDNYLSGGGDGNGGYTSDSGYMPSVRSSSISEDGGDQSGSEKGNYVLNPKAAEFTPSNNKELNSNRTLSSSDSNLDMILDEPNRKPNHDQIQITQSSISISSSSNPTPSKRRLAALKRSKAGSAVLVSSETGNNSLIDVKRGIERNSVSDGTEMRLPSMNGATHSVHQSLKKPKDFNVCASDVRGFANKKTVQELVSLENQRQKNIITDIQRKNKQLTSIHTVLDGLKDIKTNVTKTLECKKGKKPNLNPINEGEDLDDTGSTISFNDDSLESVKLTNTDDCGGDSASECMDNSKPEFPSLTDQDVREAVEVASTNRLDVGIDLDDYISSLLQHANSKQIMGEVLRTNIKIMAKINMIDEVLDKMDSLLMNQGAVMSKVDALDREVGKVGLSISAVEQLVTSMRIIIPGDIKKGSSVSGESDISMNPTLKPVIGRQNIKLDEVIDVDFDEVNLSKGVPKIKESLLLEDLDMSKTNASQFIPDSTPESRSTLCALIEARIQDPDLRSMFISAVLESDDEDSIKDIHNKIIMAIDAGF